MTEKNDGLIKVEIDGAQYNIRSGAGGAEHIRMLADFVNTMMRQVRQKAGHVSRDNIAIMAALNIAERMYDERKRYSSTVRELITELEQTLSGEMLELEEKTPQLEAIE